MPLETGTSEVDPTEVTRPRSQPMPEDRARAAFAAAFTGRVQRTDPSGSPYRRFGAMVGLVLMVAVGVVVTGFLVEFLSKSDQATRVAAVNTVATPATTGPAGGTQVGGGSGGSRSAAGGTVLAGGVTAGAADSDRLLPKSESTGKQADSASKADKKPAAGTTNSSTSTSKSTTGTKATTKPKPSASTSSGSQGGTSAAAATFSATTGPGCSTSSSANWYSYGSYSDGANGWYQTSGGSSSCGGKSISIPMSGSASASTGDNYLVWWFETGKVKEGSCQFAIYVPNTGTARDVAGRTALYKVMASGSSSSVQASFSFDQSGRRGSWVTLAKTAVHNGEIALHLADRGEDPNGEHLGAAQVKVTCTAA